MKKAFTLLELVFVIALLGIITSLTIPSFKTNALQEAAIQLSSDIRYTQHLAMIDDRYNNNIYWYQNRWRLKFYKGVKSDNKLSYTICNKEDSHTNVKLNSVAKNPLNQTQVMSGGHSSSSNKLDIRSEAFIGMSRLNLGKFYNIDRYSLSGGCRYSRISFDYLGRPLYRDPNKLSSQYKKDDSINLVDRSCRIKLIDYDNNEISIEIVPETGKVKILY